METDCQLNCRSTNQRTNGPVNAQLISGPSTSISEKPGHNRWLSDF